MITEESMKKKIILFILLLVLMLFLPLMTIIGGQRTAEETQKLISSESKASEKETDSDTASENPDRVFRILDTRRHLRHRQQRCIHFFRERGRKQEKIRQRN